MGDHSMSYAYTNSLNCCITITKVLEMKVALR